MLYSTSRRKGATLLEFAVVAPVVFFLILSLIVGGMGVFRYQEVSHLAREATRYASTHGGRYILDGMPAQTGVSAISTNSDIQTFVESRAVALDSSRLTATIAWTAPSSVVPNNIPTYLNTDLTLVPPGQSVFQNYVTVTVTYQWIPELFLVGPFTMSSTSKVAMGY